jgi:hypothetical protein
LHRHERALKEAVHSVDPPCGPRRTGAAEQPVEVRNHLGFGRMVVSEI